MADHVQNEGRSVRVLKAGVTQYASLLRSAMDSARREFAANRRRAEEIVQDRRSTLRRAEQALARARAELARCRENCGGLQQQVRVATEWVAEARQQLDRARKAVQLLTAAESDLQRSLQRAEAVVGEHTSVATAALASLDSKLRGIDDHQGFRHAVHSAVAAAVVTVKIVDATTGLAPVAGNALQAAGTPNILADSSVTEMVQREQQAAKYYKLEHDVEEPPGGDEVIS